MKSLKCGHQHVNMCSPSFLTLHVKMKPEGYSLLVPVYAAPTTYIANGHGLKNKAHFELAISAIHSTIKYHLTHCIFLTKQSAVVLKVGALRGQKSFKRRSGSQ